MPVSISKLRSVKPLAIATLEQMHTGTLLRRLADLRSLHENPAQSDWSDEELAAVREAGLLAFKDSPEWMQAFAATKAVLDQREHIPREGKEALRSAQQRKQTR